MDYNLKHKILLVENSEDSNDFPWSIREGSKRSDYIPLECEFLYFTASELRHHYFLQIEASSNSEEVEEEKEPRVESESIRGVLHPGYCNDGKVLKRDTMYSMFGTDRLIKDFRLYISKIKNPNDKEKCLIKGHVGYTTEGEGFLEETIDDSIFIDLTLTQQQFDHISELIISNCIDIFEIMLSTPSGLYSKWSAAASCGVPSGGEYYIKVLADEKYHKVETPENCKITPPRLLGNTDFEMTITQRNSLNIKQDLRGINIDELFDDVEEEKEDEKKEILESKQNEKLLAILTSLESIKGTLAFPLWMIFILLCLKFIVFK
ncbi:hypothetical protein [Legionella impletisoli]|uniref:Uncharacterized protein n=1 Tax=Legionella impletisoli TaxID=343510 RepID=A0A917NEA3_9GAMM|nr:hypothetical protein [Legionella impletisoli]GGI92287.1 hypothetical protein GCM10007966_21130 [Legionella impletisoli]